MTNAAALNTSPIQEIFLRNAEKYGQRARESGNYQQILQYAIDDCPASTQAPTIDEAENIVREWFIKVFLNFGIDSPGFEMAVPHFARILVKHCTSREPVRLRPSGSKPTQQLMGFEGLTHKSAHMDKYLDVANVTDKQREAYSLVKEYALSVSEAGRRLGIHHSTVQEYVSKVELKIQQAGSRIRSLRTPQD